MTLVRLTFRECPSIDYKAFISMRAMSGLVSNKTAMSRLISRKTRRTCLPTSSRWLSTPSRPYQFHVGASWAGKPPGPGPKRLNVPFASESVVGTWRDKTLSWPKMVNSKDAGEDFFYVQEVSLNRSNVDSRAHERRAKMRNGSVSEFCTRTLQMSLLNSTLGCIAGCCRWCGWMG